MSPKIRSPFNTWLLAFLTGGLYLFYWIFKVGKEINYGEGVYIIPVTRWALDLMIYMLLLILTFIVMIDFKSQLPFMLFCLLLIQYTFELISEIAEYVAYNQRSNSQAWPVSPTLACILFLSGILCLPYLQANINRLIRSGSGRQVLVVPQNNVILLNRLQLT